MLPHTGSSRTDSAAHTDTCSLAPALAFSSTCYHLSPTDVSRLTFQINHLSQFFAPGIPFENSTNTENPAPVCLSTISFLDYL